MAKLARKPAPVAPHSGTAQRAQAPVAAPAQPQTNPARSDQVESAMNPILQTLLEKVDSLSKTVDALSAKVEAVSAKVGDLALNFEKLRADFANHLAKSADRARLMFPQVGRGGTLLPLLCGAVDFGKNPLQKKSPPPPRKKSRKNLT